MKVYLVDVALTGRIRVAAEDEAGAAQLAMRAADLGLSAGDYKIFQPRVTEAKCVGEMQDHSLQPNNVVQKLSTKLNGG